MKKLVPQLAAIAGLAFCFQLIARELRTPLPLYHGYAHYPLLEEIEDEKDVHFDVWGGVFYRTADKAFTDCHGRSTQPYSALFFGKSDFRGEEAFAGATVTVPNNPWLSISTMKPRVRYTERGVHFGLDVTKTVNDDWQAGLRLNLPFRIIDVDRVRNCNTFSSDLGGERLEDVVDFKPEVSPDTNNGIVGYAFRLDFLSLLPYAVVGPAVKQPLVNYANPAFGGAITIANQQLAVNRVHAVKRNDGTKPPSNVRYSDLAANAADPINGAGSNLNNDERGRFDGTDNFYQALSQDRAAQSRWWVTPVVDNPGVQTVESQRVQQTVNDLLAVLDDSAEDFFVRQCVCFQSQRRAGIGDLDIECFGNFTVTDEFWVEGIFGLRIPTGRRVNEPQNVFLMPTGNNGHLEVKVGGQAGLDVIDGLKIKADAAYSFAVRRTEKVAAPFLGATVKNIGPCVDAKVSWGYFLGHFDFTVVDPKSQCIGFNLGYELYAKGRDRVSVGCACKDFLCKSQEIDDCILEKFTRVVAHKVRTEFFFEGSCYNLFAGWNHVVAGKNAPKETDWYIGINVSF